MIVSILHFSDIHFTKDRNVVFQRKEKIFEAIKNELKGKDFLLIITSGDIAFSGNTSEYNIAKEFYKYLFQSIKEYTSLQGCLLFVPGNHDCLFNEADDEIRRIVIEKLSEESVKELSQNVIEICCKPQENFNSFITEINKRLPYLGDTVFDHPLLKVITFRIDDKIFKFNCFNTSWDSSKNEKIGNLKFPIDYLYDQIPTIDNYFTFSILHHPFNWQTPQNSKDFREALTKSSEIIISGHEHQNSQSIYSDLENNYKTLHIESGALQESNNDRESEFNIINIDTSNISFQIKSYKYDTINANYKIGKESNWEKIEKEKKLKTKEFQLKKTFIADLESPGASFTHSNIDEIFLTDIFTPPIFNNISFNRDKKTKLIDFVHSESALNLDDQKVENFYKLVLGNESSGKTALLKYFYLKYYGKDFYPVLLSVDNLTEVKKDKLKVLIGKAFKNQYDELENKFENIDYDKIILLIDDLHRYKYKKSKVTLIHNLTSLFKKIIITGNELMLFESYTNIENKTVELFELFDQYIIQEFNPTLRNLLINKWYRLGREYLSPEEKIEFYHQVDQAAVNINVIIGKNLIPSFPVYILSILQALESGQTDSTSNNLHAYYYEMLITRSLRKVLNDQDDIGFYMTFCKEYFYFLFDQKIRFKPIPKDDFLKFLKYHTKKYSLSNLNADAIINVLTDSKILKVNPDLEISITYKYLYYYFVAKFLSDNLDDQDTKRIIDKMTDRVYREEYSNILLFLTHLSKSTFIIDTLVEKSRKIFAGIKPIKLESDIDFINMLQKDVPVQVLKNLDVEDSRQSNLIEEDEYENREKEFEDERNEEDYDLDEDINSLDHLALLTKALRTINILGQLTKKYWGELLGPDKYNLAEETFMLGLRTLKFHFEEIEKGKDFLSEHIIKIIQKRFVKDNLTKVEVEAVSVNFIFTLSSSSVFGVLKRIVNAIGTEKLANTFNEVENNHPYNSTKLTIAGIKLDHYSGFPMNEIENLKKANEKNPLVLSALQTFVIDHLYMYPIAYDKKQKICDLLNIKIQEQRFIAESTQIRKV